MNNNFVDEKTENHIAENCVGVNELMFVDLVPFSY